MTPFSDYLAKLLHDDDALVSFLEDPIHAVAFENAQKDDHGKPIMADESEVDDACPHKYKLKPVHQRIKKTDRAVLRRVLLAASTNTPNGYAIIRPSNSYRSAIRMLQNVLHHHEAAGAVTGQAVMNNDSVAIRVYYSGNPSDPKAQNPGASPYAAFVFGIAPRTPNMTVKDALDTAKWYGPTVSYKTVTDPNTGAVVVSAFTIGNDEYTAPPKELPKGAGTPFWFYSFDGRPHRTARGFHDPCEPDAGKEAESFTDMSVGNHHSVNWEVIAPASYGYGFCKPVSASEDEVLQKAFAAE